MNEFPILQKLKILVHEPHWIVNNEKVCKAADVERMLKQADELYGIQESESWVFRSQKQGGETHKIKALGLEPISKGVSKKVLIEALKMQGSHELAEHVEKFGVAE